MTVFAVGSDVKTDIVILINTRNDKMKHIEIGCFYLKSLWI